MKGTRRARLLGALAAAATVTPALAQPSCEAAGGGGAVKLTVEVSNLRDARGQTAVTVYPDNPKRFLARGGKLARARVPTTLPTTRSCFWLPPGAYAVAVYHDHDGDRDFDRTSVGMPAEGFGFSNDAPTRFGLPAFEAARFRLPAGGGTIKVRMRYPR